MGFAVRNVNMELWRIQFMFPNPISFQGQCKNVSFFCKWSTLLLMHRLMKEKRKKKKERIKNKKERRRTKKEEQRKKNHIWSLGINWPIASKRILGVQWNKCKCSKIMRRNYVALENWMKIRDMGTPEDWCQGMFSWTFWCKERCQMNCSYK